MSNYKWVGGNMSVAGSWLRDPLPSPPPPLQVPGPGDSATFSIGGALLGSIGVSLADFLGGTYDMQGAISAANGFLFSSDSLSTGATNLTIEAGAMIAATGTVAVEQVGGTKLAAAITQKAGANTSWQLSVNQGSSYSLQGGTLGLTGFLVLNGTSLPGGVFTQSGGTATLFGITEDEGSYTLSGGSLTIGAGNEFIAAAPGGTASFTQTGGTHVVNSDLQVGEFGTGTYTLSGGTLSSVDEHIGQNSTGTFTQTRGTHTVSGRMVIGTFLPGTPSPAGTGTYTLGGTGTLSVQTIFDGSEPGCTGFFNFNTAAADAATLLISGTGGFPGLIVGGQGTGTFIESDGSISATVDLGFMSTGIGTYDLDEGTLNATTETIGDAGMGTFTQDGGTDTDGSTGGGSARAVNGGLAQAALAGLPVKFDLVLGNLPNAVGLRNLNAGALVMAGEAIGLQGNGTFVQAGGMNTVNGPGLVLGSAATAVGFYTMNAGALVAVNETIGDAGTGTFTQNAGNNTVNGALVVGHASAAGNKGTYSLFNGNLTSRSEIIGDAGTGVFNQLVGASVNTVTTGDLIVGNADGGDGTYNLHDGTLNITKGDLTLGLAPNSTGTFNFDTAAGDTGAIAVGPQVVTVGDGGTGTFTQGNGALTADLVLGSEVGGDGTFVLDNGSVTSMGQTVGDAGTGRFVQNNGQNTITDNGLTIGNSTGGAGTYDLDTGILDVQNGDLILADAGNSTGTLNFQGDAAVLTVDNGVIQVGFHGNARFNQIGGIISNKVIVGSQIGSTGTYDLSDAGMLTSLGQIVGNNGTGTFNQDDGTNGISGGDLILGAFSLGSGKYNFNNGVLFAAGEIIGNDGLGSFVQASGANVVSGASVVAVVVGGPTNVINDASTAVLALGAQADGTGAYELDTGTLNAGVVNTGAAPIAGQEIIGNAGKGSFLQKGGTNTITGTNLKAEASLLIGELATGSGTYEIDAGSLLVGATGMAGREIVGDSGLGAFIQKGGTNTVTGGGLAIGAHGDGSYALTGGALAVVGGSMGLGSSAGGVGTLTVSTATVTAPVLTIGGAGKGIVNAGTAGAIAVATAIQMAAGSELHANNGTVTVGGGLTGQAGMVQIASGASLTGAGLLDANLNIASGATVTATGGSLHITGQITGNGTVTVSPGAALEIGGSDTAAVAFAGGPASLVLDAPAGFGGVITGFAPGETIFLSGITDVASVTLGSGNVLTVHETKGSGINLALNPAANFAGENFSFTPAASGTSLTLTPTVATAVTNAYTAILRAAPTPATINQQVAAINAGSLTLSGLEAQLLALATGNQLPAQGADTIPALLSYDLSFNATPASSGLTYLTTYGEALQSGDYTYDSAGVFQLGTSPGQFSSLPFSLQNVYVNLCATFAGVASGAFAAEYGSLDRPTFVNQVYTQIFGAAPAAATQQFLLNSFPFYLSYAGTEMGARGSIAGVLMSLAEQTNAGLYPPAANAFLLAAANGTALYGPELIAQFPSGISAAAAAVDQASATVTSFTVTDTAANVTAAAAAPRADSKLAGLTVTGTSGGDTLDLTGFAVPAMVNLDGDTAAASGGLKAPALTFIGAPDAITLGGGAATVDYALQPGGGIETIANFQYGLDQLNVDLAGAANGVLSAFDTTVNGAHAIAIYSSADATHGVVLTGLAAGQTAANLVANHLTFSGGHALIG